MAKCVLHDMLASRMAPIHELSTTHLVASEVPPVATAKFEHDLLNFIQKLPALHVPVLVVVQPSLRRKTNKAFCVHKWNHMAQIPFKFYQTCSRRTYLAMILPARESAAGCARLVLTKGMRAAAGMPASVGRLPPACNRQCW